MENIAPALLEWFLQEPAHPAFPLGPDALPRLAERDHAPADPRLGGAALLRALPPPCRTFRPLPPAKRKKLHKLWEGLGYYSRVRNLQKAAQHRLARSTAASFRPTTTPSAPCPASGTTRRGHRIHQLFGIPVPAVDGNVLRVFSRLYNDPAAVTEPAVKKAFTARVMEHQPPDAPGDQSGPLWSWGRWSACRTVRPCAKNARSPICAPPVLRALHWTAPQSSAQAPQTAACDAGPAGKPGRFLLQQRPQKGVCLPGCGNRYLWEGEALLPPERSCPPAGHGDGYRHRRAGSAARCKAHLQPHRVAYERHPAACARPRCPGRLRVGKPGSPAGRVCPCPVHLSHIRSLWYEILAFFDLNGCNF